MTTQRMDSRDLKQSWPLLNQTIARLNKDYRLSLLHCYCAKICKTNLVLAERFSSIENSERLKTLMNIFPNDKEEDLVHILQLQTTEMKDYMY